MSEDGEQKACVACEHSEADHDGECMVEGCECTRFVDRETLEDT